MVERLPYQGASGGKGGLESPTARDLANQSAWMAPKERPVAEDNPVGEEMDIENRREVANRIDSPAVLGKRLSSLAVIF
jgi:hypothetical protein